jgi:hypothetical protein
MNQQELGYSAQDQKTDMTTTPKGKASKGIGGDLDRLRLFLNFALVALGIVAVIIIVFLLSQPSGCDSRNWRGRYSCWFLGRPHSGFNWKREVRATNGSPHRCFAKKALALQSQFAYSKGRFISRRTVGCL